MMFWIRQKILLQQEKVLP